MIFSFLHDPVITAAESAARSAIDKPCFYHVLYLGIQLSIQINIYIGYTMIKPRNEKYSYVGCGGRMMVSCRPASPGFLTRRRTSYRDSDGKPVILRGIGLGGWDAPGPYMLKMSEVSPAQYDIRKRFLH